MKPGIIADSMEKCALLHHREGGLQAKKKKATGIHLSLCGSPLLAYILSSLSLTSIQTSQLDNNPFVFSAFPANVYCFSSS